MWSIDPEVIHGSVLGYFKQVFNSETDGSQATIEMVLNAVEQKVTPEMND